MLNATFRIEDFTYNNTSILEVLFGYLEKTQFRGITVSQLVINTYRKIDFETNKQPLSFKNCVILTVHISISACSIYMKG